jgi:hypothetical protein
LNSARLKESYKTNLAWDGPDPSAPLPTIVGGSQTIGVENMYDNALMDAIYCGSNGHAWKDSRFTIYGWMQPGANVSTSHTRFNYATGTGGNYPAAYSFEPNTVTSTRSATAF